MGLCASKNSLHYDEVPPYYDATFIKAVPQEHDTKEVLFATESSPDTGCSEILGNEPAAEVEISHAPAPCYMSNIPLCSCLAFTDKHYCIASDVVLDSNGRAIRVVYFPSCLGQVLRQNIPRCTSPYCTGSDIMPTLGGFFCARHAAHAISYRKKC
jgi:hypothetical protein